MRDRPIEAFVITDNIVIQIVTNYSTPISASSKTEHKTTSLCNISNACGSGLYGKRHGGKKRFVLIFAPSDCADVVNEYLYIN